MARKTTAKSEVQKSTAVKADAVKATSMKIESTKAEPAKLDAVEAEVAKAPRAKTAKAKPATTRNLFSLQLVPGAAVLAENVSGGLVVAPKLKPGCTLAISYLKELGRPLTAAKLHARIDGVPVGSKPLGHTDADGRFVRTTAALELAPDAQKLEFWFELTTAEGETLWDSNWGRNHWLEVQGSSAELTASKS